MKTTRDDNHIYKNEQGLIIPSVTQILKTEGFANFDKVPELILKRACGFGTNVDLACELEDDNNLDYGTLDSSILDYLTQWQKFKKEYAVEIIHNKVRVHSDKYGFVGEADRLVKIKDSLVLIDIKTCTTINNNYCALQLAGYEIAYKEEFKERKSIKRYVVQLKKDKYKVVEYKDKQDVNDFLSLARSCKIKIKRGIYE